MSTANSTDEILHKPSARPRRLPDLNSSVLPFLEAYALLLLLGVVVVFFTVYPATADTFPTAENLRILVANQTVIAVVALGAVIPLVAYEFDLSIGAMTGLSAVFVASALSSGVPVVAAVAIGVAIGSASGLVNALLVTRLNVNGVIVTLGVATVLGGIVVQKTGGRSVVSNIPESVTEFGTGTTLGIPTVAFALLAVVAVVHYLLAHTPFGRQLYAFGSNRDAARLVGIRTKLVLGLTFVLSGVLCGTAGVLQVSRSGGADPGIGEMLTLPALAAAFLSAASIKPGRYNVGGVLVAVFFLATLNNGLNLAGAAPYVASYVNGIALVLGVALAVNIARKRGG